MIIIISNKGEGGSNLCTPSCSGPPASSNFYTRKIKKILHAGGYPWASTSLSSLTAGEAETRRKRVLESRFLHSLG